MTSVRIERERLEDFRRAAAANRRTVSQELRWLIDQRVEDWKREAEPATEAA